MNAIEDRTKQIIADTLGIDPSIITPQTNLHNDLGADSLDVVDTIDRLEKEFGVTIPDDKIERMSTVLHFTEYFESVKPFPTDYLNNAKAA